MNSTAQTPVEPPAKVSRRNRIFTFVIENGPQFAFLVLQTWHSGRMSSRGASSPSRAASRRSWKINHDFPVRGHMRNQACGPGLSLRRPTYIGPYAKGPNRASI